jgi:hypothetical protein
MQVDMARGWAQSARGGRGSGRGDLPGVGGRGPVAPVKLMPHAAFLAMCLLGKTVTVDVRAPICLKRIDQVGQFDHVVAASLPTASLSVF